MVKEQINMDYQFRLTENNTSLVKDKPGSRIAWFVKQNFKKPVAFLQCKKAEQYLLQVYTLLLTQWLNAWQHGLKWTKCPAVRNFHKNVPPNFSKLQDVCWGMSSNSKNQFVFFKGQILWACASYNIPWLSPNRNSTPLVELRSTRGRFNSPTPTRRRIKSSRNVGELVFNPVQLIRS